MRRRAIGQSWAPLAVLSLMILMATFHTTVVALDSAESEDLRLPRSKGETDILVVVAVDGTLAGISRSSGNVMWKKKPESNSETLWSPSSTTTFGRMQPNKRSPTAASTDASAFIRPLLSTTTTTQSASTTDYAAVPSIDGSVYLTTEALSLTVSTSVKELVQRAPFLDPNGKFYVGGRETTAAAIDVKTGRVLSIVSSGTADNLSSQKNLVGHSVLWMGRVDYSVTVHDSRTGVRNVQFGVAEIRDVEKLKTDSDSDCDHLLPDGALPSYSMPNSLHRLVSTPSGNLGLLDSVSGRIMWVTTEQFQTPVAFAIDADTGASINVEIVADVKVPSSNDMEYLRQELERQVELMDSASHLQEGISDQTIVGRLEATGQLYALPLRRRRLISSSLPPSSNNHAAAVASTAKHYYIPKLTGGRAHLSQPTEEAKRPCHPTSSNFPACLVDHHKYQPPRLEYFAKGHDNRLLSEGPPPELHHELAIVNARNDPPEPLVYHPDLGYVHQNVLRPRSRTSKILKILGSWLPPTIALIFVLSFEMGRRKRLQDDKTGTAKNEGSNELKGSTEVSMEQTKKTEKLKTSISPVDDHFPQKQPRHLIQVSDQVLGFGGQGTVVYKGLLDGREVAVKRMLKAYHASADREIRLLIESDGHPNVVRYFLKEVRGDFVYLALELCDLSLHELIGVLRHSAETCLLQGIPIVATKAVLKQIAAGVCHLHSLRIVHRDLKPANILLAVSKNDKKRQGSNTLQTFLTGHYVAKISDMGLGKQMVGQSSLGASLMATPSFQGTKGGINSVGIGPGSVGWQAPEVMALRWLASDSSARSAESNAIDNEVSPEVPSPNPPTSRSVDIFSLGCIFFATLVPGHHPFGEWYEREANIMHNRVAISPLEKISKEALHLVRAMLSRDPKLRPTAKQICDHPFFWTPPKKMSFLCEFSDRLEVDTTIPTSFQPISSLTVEGGAVDVVGTSWDERLDEPLIRNMQRFRTYDPSSVRDLLRLIRNKHHHYDELPQDFLADMSLCQDTLVEYFERKFPRLLMHCWDCCRTTLSDDDPLMRKYCIPASAPISPVSHRPHTIPSAPELIVVPPNRLPSRTDEVKMQDAQELTFDIDGDIASSDVGPSKRAFEVLLPPSDSSKIHGGIENDGSSADIIAWAGSTTAKELNCRGWNRSDAEWAKRIDPLYRKKDPNLKRAMEDTKFRTRLCNHWDESMGTFCPMRKKNKCVFAHGPVELRVKDGKKNRWGKLVDKNGDNNNPWHSGGEDTYGAARSIETTRREEGKWNTGRKGKKPNGNKKGKVIHEKD